MRKLKKLLCVIFLFSTLINHAVLASAAAYSTTESVDYEKLEEDAKSIFRVLSKMTELRIEENVRHSDYRSIFVRWDEVDGADCYQIQLSDNPYFYSCKSTIVPARRNLCYSFSINDNIDAAYYIRIRPAVDVKGYNGYYRMFGYRWSNTVTAK